MKTFKRLFCAILTVAIIASSLFSVNVFADDEAVSFTDVAENNQYYDAIYSLAKDGVVNGIKQDDGTLAFKPEDTITRAEVATLIAIYLVKDETLLTSTTDKFPDVSLDHWANKYIAYAVQTDIVAGNDDGTFRPANPVTYGEVCKMLVCAKGYGEVYEATTPWYEGYVNIANKINITKNAVSTGDKEASRGIVAQLIYNMEGVQYYQPKTQPSVGGGGGGGGSGGRVSKDVEEELEEENGVVVQAVFETSITGEEIDLTYKQVMIGDVVYNIGNFKLDDLYKYLGRRLNIEYEESGTGKKTLRKIELSSKDDVISIYSDDFVGVDGREITYYPYGENKSKTITLADDLCVVYNGKPVPRTEITDEFISEYLNIENGTMKLINNNGGKDFDFVEVEKYDTYVVSSKSNSGDIYTVVDYLGQSYSFDATKATLYVSRAKKSVEEGKATAIAAKKVLFVSEPYGEDKEGTIIIISENKIQNKKVDSISDTTVTIDDKEYEETPYLEKLREKSPKDYSYETGDTGTFYLDYYGNIAFYEKAENKTPYAYIMGFENGDGLDGVKSVYLLTMGSGTTVTPKVCFLDETVKINGQRKDSKDLGPILKETAAAVNKKSLTNEVKIENGEYSQLVRCKTSTRKINDETVNFVDEIYTMDYTDWEDGEVVPAPFRALKTAEKDLFTDGKNRLKYYSSSKAFQDDGGSNQFIINSSTVVLLVPDDRSDAEEYKRKTYSYFSNGTKYDVEPYDIKSNIAGVVLVYTRGVSTKPVVTVNSTYPAFVVDVRPAQNPDGEEVQQLTYFDYKTKITDTTKPVKILTEKATTLSGVQAGDIIKFVYETKRYGDEEVKEIIDVQKVFSNGVLMDWKSPDIYETFPAEGNFISHSYSSTSNYYQVIHGTLDDKMLTDSSNGSISVVPMIVENNEDYNNEKYEQYTITSSTAFFKWNDDTDTFDPNVDASYLASVVEAQGDATSASRIVVIKALGSGSNAQSIYILD